MRQADSAANGVKNRKTYGKSTRFGLYIKSVEFISGEGRNAMGTNRYPRQATSRCDWQQEADDTRSPC
jgi:hypothetical protein